MCTETVVTNQIVLYGGNIFSGWALMSVG